ncbi:hypothetical protein BDA96_02G031500 [Sorghum bicolor]|uniref:Bifunctional inhibitor/plant lipid transfer protein/seed storage helical domain-containing protein n=2 Tax=Sorghum bicolor TaxID=4558 RepID=A0A921RL14_SORBI|nr:hypothetical protein BDA96_02G031500 [Sorghum bicolor]KXG34381.1 hypothetical protein SORBI_3002G031200 [Sorghum bicolor]
MAGKVAILLLLVVSLAAMASPHQAKLGCRDFEKARILHDCREFIRPEGRYIIPTRNGNCCWAVRVVPGLDMPCIITLLTPVERKQNSESKILGLRNVCM